MAKKAREYTPLEKQILGELRAERQRVLAEYGKPDWMEQGTWEYVDWTLRRFVGVRLYSSVPVDLESESQRVHPISSDALLPFVG
jgi:hypothetical protein